MRPYVPPDGSIPTLPVPDLSGLRRVHLMGIAGAGMSGIAHLLLDRGFAVSGCDLKGSTGLNALRARGAEIAVGHDPAHHAGVDAVVISSAIRPGDAELAAAREAGIPVLHRAQVLAALAGVERSVAVAGTHGKTTTTSMLAVALVAAGLDPTYVIGGELNESGSNARSGTGGVFVAEADESDGSFLLMRPSIGVVTNVEADHLDFFGTLEEVEAAFAAFCARCDHLVACGDDPGTRRVLALAGREATTYGEKDDNDVVLHIGELGPEASGRVRIGAEEIDLRLRVPGRHCLLNATAAVAVVAALGGSAAEAAAALAGFRGVRRRFEHRSSIGGARVVDDYAHHPSEIEATLAAAATERPERMVAVFQPHRYSRTAALGRELGRSLAAADVVVVTDVYAAGEHPVPGVSGKMVVDGLVEAAPGKRAIYLPSRADVAPFVARELRRGDLILTLGAGDVTMVGEEVVRHVGGEDRG